MTKKEPIFINVSKIDQVVYDQYFDSCNPITVSPGGTVTGKHFAKYTGKGKPFKRVTGEEITSKENRQE